MNERSCSPDEALEALNKAQRSARNSWLFLLSLSLIIIVTVGGIHHADLLLNANVRLPVVQVKVPVRSFFFFAPLLLLVTWAWTLLQHHDLACKIHLYQRLADAAECAALPGYHLVQMLAGRRRGLRWLHGSLHWLTLAALPLMVLLYLQIAWLPSHEVKMTWWHRASVIAGGAMLVLYGRAIWGAPRWCLDSVLATPVILFSLIVATIPDEWSERLLCGTSDWLSRKICVPVPLTDAKRNGSRTGRKAFSPTAILFEGEVNYASGGLTSPFARNLVILSRDLAGRSTDGPRLNLRNRDLRYATLDDSNLRRADFTASDLTGASLRRTNLEEAVFGCAETGRRWPHRKSVSEKKTTRVCGYLAARETQKCTIMDEVDLSKANLLRAYFDHVRMPYADLSEANMKEVKIKNSCLSRSYMDRTNLESATIERSNIVGLDAFELNLKKSKITESDMSFSYFYDSNFSNTDIVPPEFIEGEDFIQKRYGILGTTRLIGIYMKGSMLYCSDMRSATLLGSYLGCSYIWGVTPPSRYDLQFSIISHLRITDKVLSPKLRNCGMKDEKLIKINRWWEKEGKKLKYLPKKWGDGILEIACGRKDYFIGAVVMILRECDWSDVKLETYDPPPFKDKRIAKIEEFKFSDENGSFARGDSASGYQTCENPFPKLRQTLAERLKQKNCKAAQGIEEKVLALLNKCMKKERERQKDIDSGNGKVR